MGAMIAMEKPSYVYTHPTWRCESLTTKFE